MKKLTILLAILLLIPPPAMACDSYEDCMACVENYGDVMADNASCSSGQGHLDLYKAIAYKLDEISKKLDKRDPRETILT